MHIKTSNPELIRTLIVKAKQFPARVERTINSVPESFLWTMSILHYKMVPYYTHEVLSAVDSPFFSYKVQTILGDAVNILTQDEPTVKLCALPEETLKMMMELETDEQQVRALVAYLTVSFLKKAEDDHTEGGK